MAGRLSGFSFARTECKYKEKSESSEFFRKYFYSNLSLGWFSRVLRWSAALRQTGRRRIPGVDEAGGKGGGGAVGVFPVAAGPFAVLLRVGHEEPQKEQAEHLGRNWKEQGVGWRWKRPVAVGVTGTVCGCSVSDRYMTDTNGESLLVLRTLRPYMGGYTEGIKKRKPGRGRALGPYFLH